jgi:hypothetical protein
LPRNRRTWPILQPSPSCWQVQRTLCSCEPTFWTHFLDGPSGSRPPRLMDSVRKAKAGMVTESALWERAVTARSLALTSGSPTNDGSMALIPSEPLAAALRGRRDCQPTPKEKRAHHELPRQE